MSEQAAVWYLQWGQLVCSVILLIVGLRLRKRNLPLAVAVTGVSGLWLLGALWGQAARFVLAPAGQYDLINTGSRVMVFGFQPLHWVALGVAAYLGFRRR